MDTKKEQVEENQTKLTDGYKNLIERTKKTLNEIDSEIPPALHDAMEVAKKKAVEIGELTAIEADKVAEFVRRDIYDAAQYIKTKERELADWLKLDLLLLKKNILDDFDFLVKQMQSEIKHISKNMEPGLTWKTGEITGIGTLECDHCHALIHFHKAGHIPPCPKCQKTDFHRQWHK